MHLEYFDNVEQLVEEKLKLAQAIGKGMVIINGDDKYLHEACKKIIFMQLLLEKKHIALAYNRV